MSACLISLNIYPRFLENSLYETKCLPILSRIGGQNNSEELAGFLSIEQTSESVKVLNFRPNLLDASSAVKRPAASKAPQPKKKPALPVVSNMGAPKVVNPVSTVQVTTPAQLFSDCIIDGKKMYICAVCSYRSNKMSNIKRHVDSNHNQNRSFFKCSTCGKTFTDRSPLKSHYIKVHSFEEAVAKAAADAATAHNQ